MTPQAILRLQRARFAPSPHYLRPLDPFSPDYALQQKDLHRKVAAKDYSIENEEISYDPEAVIHNFFPFNTQSPEFVGLQLQSQGFLIRNLNLKPGSRIVEFGAGWGNTALNLALMGYDVTAVELNPPSIELMRHRAAIHHRKIHLVRQEMLEYSSTTEDRFDAAIFVASFHHCADPLALLKNLGRILSPQGQIIFADEPIFPAALPTLPYPWGLRLDAETLYYVRRHGWLELGFQESFFREALRRNGWKVRRILSTVPVVGDLFIAERIQTH
jgi:2-polyprenyl-3-methyl-5-hydroxy-6-metoxy-1,4-benzoquinol methylase